jgi:hypothetical protein
MRGERGARPRIDQRQFGQGQRPPRIYAPSTPPTAPVVEATPGAQLPPAVTQAPIEGRNRDWNGRGGRDGVRGWRGNGGAIEGNQDWRNRRGDSELSGQRWRNNDGDGDGRRGSWRTDDRRRREWSNSRLHRRTEWSRHHRSRDWWRSRYNRFALFGGGYYYWNGGYWYPAYGYDPYFSTYTYDAPIYSYNDQDPGQVITNVQQALQEQGYYQGELDGTFGPMTRDALLNYQRDNGLPVTGEIDQDTLAALGFE